MALKSIKFFGVSVYDNCWTDRDHDIQTSKSESELASVISIVTTIKAPSISSIIGSQIGAVFLLALISFGFLGRQTSLSLGIGGLLCLVANTVFTLKAFKYRGASAAEQIVKEFVSGEVYKILLSGAGFALIFIYSPAAQPSLVLLGYIAVHLVGMISTIHVVRTYNQAGI